MGDGSTGIIFDDPEWPLTGHCIYLQVEYLKNGAFLGQSYWRTLIGNHTQSIEWYHFQWPWVTFDPDFKVTTFFDIQYLKNETRYSHSYHITSTGSRMRSIEWWHFQWPWRTANRVFKVMAFLKSNIWKTEYLRHKVSIEH